MNKRANIFVYIFLLVFMIGIMWTYVFDELFIVIDNKEFQFNNENIVNKIKDKWNLSISLVKSYNANGSWFVDNLSCPQDITMSWTTSSGSNINSTLNYQNWFIFCLWEYNNNDFKLFFDNNTSKIEKAYYLWNTINLENISSIYNWIEDFNDIDNTLITFRENSTLLWDWIDDNFNSDNYKVDSNWIDNYPWSYQDDDTFPRKNIIWSIGSFEKDENIFWSNSKTNTIINNNSNNNDFLNKKISEIEKWYINLYFSDNNDILYDIKIVEFDRVKYEAENTLLPINIFIQKDLNQHWWFLQKEESNLSFSEVFKWFDINPPLHNTSAIECYFQIGLCDPWYHY